MQTQARTPGAPRARGGSSGSTALMSEYISLILKPTHSGNSSTHQKLIQRMRKKGRMESSFQITVRADGLTKLEKSPPIIPPHREILHQAGEPDTCSLKNHSRIMLGTCTCKRSNVIASPSSPSGLVSPTEEPTQHYLSPDVMISVSKH